MIVKTSRDITVIPTATLGRTITTESEALRAALAPVEMLAGIIPLAKKINVNADVHSIKTHSTTHYLLHMIEQQGSGYILRRDPRVTALNQFNSRSIAYITILGLIEYGRCPELNNASVLKITAEGWQAYKALQTQCKFGNLVRRMIKDPEHPNAYRRGIHENREGIKIAYFQPPVGSTITLETIKEDDYEIRHFKSSNIRGCRKVNVPVKINDDARRYFLTKSW